MRLPTASPRRAGPDAETMASLPEMRRGGIAAALVKVVARHYRSGSPLWGYRGPEMTYAAARAQLAYYQMLEVRGAGQDPADGDGHLRPPAIRGRTVQSREGLSVGFILGMEGADPILETPVRWPGGGRTESGSSASPTTASAPTATAQGPEPRGDCSRLPRPCLRAMDSAGMILDVTHASDASVREALDLFGGPVLASHQNCRAIVPGERQFPDDQLRAVISRGGVIGASMDSWMLYRPGLDWGGPIPPRRSVYSKEAVTLEDLLRPHRPCLSTGGQQPPRRHRRRHRRPGRQRRGSGGSRHGGRLPEGSRGVLERRGYSSEAIENVM